MIGGIIPDNERLGRNGRKELLDKPLGEGGTIYLPMIIAGAWRGVKHQLSTPHPPRRSHGVNDDQPRAFAGRFIHPRSVGRNIPGVILGMVDVEIRFIQINLRSVGATRRGTVASFLPQILPSGNDDVVPFFEGPTPLGRTVDKAQALYRAPERVARPIFLVIFLSEPIPQAAETDRFTPAGEFAHVWANHGLQGTSQPIAGFAPNES